MKNKLLSVNNLRKIFHTEQDDVLALENINFDVYDNEFISIVGPSGCGKSTILSILIGLEIPSDGNVEVLENISVGYMLQSDCLFEWLTIFDNCLLGLEITNKLNWPRYFRYLSGTELLERNDSGRKYFAGILSG